MSDYEDEQFEDQSMSDDEGYTESDKPERAKSYKYWCNELNAAEKRLKNWQTLADKIVDRFKAESANINSTDAETMRLNLLFSNVTTLESMLYGSVPKVDVSRRYADAEDDVSRVAAEIIERMLNEEIQCDNGKEIDSVLRSALQDRLLAGLGAAKVRYTVETDENADGEEYIKNESAPIDYYYWGDVLWGWSRNFADLPWIAFRNYLSKEEAEKRFGEDKAKQLTYNVRTVNVTDDDAEDSDQNSETKQAEVWEIWDKTTRTVCWVHKDFKAMLDCKEDPLELRGFFPSPPFLMANPTTKLYMPTPDFKLAEDLYNEIDLLQTRISILTDAVKAVGVYDKNADGVQRMFQEGTDNTLIPVDSWAAFSEKGGIKGAVDWMPIDAIVTAIDRLTAIRNDTIALLQQVTGMSDVMRGELKNQYEGVGQTSQKAKFGSVRVQALQDQFAGFATDLMQLRAEVISKHFSPESILKQSRIANTPDRATPQVIEQAIAVIKDPQNLNLSVIIRPESIAMIDYAELKVERTEFLNAMSQFIQVIAPVVQQNPEAEPFMLELMQWSLAGFKGAQQVEALFDRTVESAKRRSQEQSQNQQPSPEQLAAQAEMQKMQAQTQAELQKIQAKAQADMQIREQDKQADMETAQLQHTLAMRQIQATAYSKQLEQQLKTEARLLEQQNDADQNIRQSQAAAEADNEKTAFKTAMKIEELVTKSEGDYLAKMEEARLNAEQRAQERRDNDDSE